jgi:hypothetical protein
MEAVAFRHLPKLTLLELLKMIVRILTSCCGIALANQSEIRLHRRRRFGQKALDQNG